MTLATSTTDRAELITDLVGGRVLRPVIDVGACEGCGKPSMGRRNWAYCGDCLTLRRLHDRPLRSFEPISFARTDERLFGMIRAWKEEGCATEGPLSNLPGSYGRPIAAILSAYLEAHREDLDLDAETTLVTFVPTRSPVVGQALALAAARDWYAPPLTETGSADPVLPCQRSMPADRRVRRSADSWSVLGPVESARIVLIDDIYTTGASMHSFARALRDAGAAEVRAVAVVRTVGGYVYSDTLERRRTRGTLTWSAEARWTGQWR